MQENKDLLFEVAEDALLVANGGRPFSRTGVISACASHLSDKLSGNVTDHFDASDEHLTEAILEKELEVYRTDVNRMTSDFRDEEETAHDYDGRFIWELLQNADDAMGTGRSSDDLIGSKGLGFKAVLEITDAPEIHSGSFHFQFSAKKTQSLLREGFPNTSPPPLTFRIPHECPPSSRTQTLLGSGYTTVIRLPFRNSEARITTVDRLNALDHKFLLLTQELVCVRLYISGSETSHEIRRSCPGFASGEVTLSSRVRGDSLTTSWRRWILQRPAPTETSKQLTVGICLPTRHGLPVPCDSPTPLHVFFPTEEDSAARALLHASFDLEHNRKRTRKGENDENILKDFAQLLRDVLKEIPPRCALEAFGEVVADHDHTPLNILQNQIRTQLLETPFIPVIGGERVKPREVQIWDNGLGAVLRHDPQEVRQARLLTPDLLKLRPVLRKLNGRNLDGADFVRLLRFCCNGSLRECIESWRVLVSSLERAGEFAAVLRQVPCWCTDTGVRALDGSHPLLIKRPPDWPNWLPADSLHPKMREELNQWEEETSDKETAPFWRELLAARVLRGQREFLEYALLPFIATWELPQWEVRGWAALRQVLRWSQRHEFGATAPWIDDPDGRKNKGEILRDQTAKTLRLPTDKGWLPAADCYAGEAWSGPRAFDRYFAGIRDRGVLRSFKDWPASIKGGEADQDQWMGFLRWSGVSWEPKVRHVRGLPDNHLLESYRDQIPSYYRWLVDWRIECFPDCLLQWHEGTPAIVIRTMLPLVGALEQKRARYYRSRYFEKKGERHWADESFAAHQLRNEEWLPCKEALFHDGRWVAPRKTFLPGRGLRGLLPEVDRGGFENEEWYQQIDPALRFLAVRDQLPADPVDWHSWMRKLPELFRRVDDFPERICEALYRRYLQLELVEELPEDIDIPCIVWKDGSGELEFAPPCQVFHVDQPHFDEVRDKILREGYRIFIIRLSAGERAPKRLGIKPLSDVLQAEPVHETSDHYEKRLFFNATATDARA